MTDPTAGRSEPGVPLASYSFGLTPLQEGMLVHGLADPVPGVDLEQILCSTSEPLDLRVLGRAWLEVMGRHPALRSHFVWEGVDAPQQVVSSDCVLDMQVVDLAGGGPGEFGPAEERLETFLRRDRETPFDLSQPPLMRIRVLPSGGDEWHCLWTFHHILLDGRSFPIILREVFTAYERYRAGEEPDFPPPPASQHDFFRWHAEAYRPEASEGFWRELLRGFHAPTPLPMAGLGPVSDARPRVEARELWLAEKEVAELDLFARSMDVTLNTLVQAAWVVLLHHYSGERDIVFAATRACRRSIDGPVADSVGLLINTLPLRVDLDAVGTLTDLLLRLRTLSIELRAHEHTPLADVRRWSDVAPGRPLFDSLVVFENYLLEARMRGRGGRWRDRRFRYRGQTNFPLALVAYGHNGLLLRLEYRPNMFDEGRAGGLLAQFATLLKGFPGRATDDPTAVPYQSDEEIRHALGAAPDMHPVAECIHELFEASARVSPDATALVHDGDRLTYQELDERAATLAAHLRSVGVKRDVLVGLVMERSADLIVGILAILKAGGAYVPIDPANPAERIRFVLDDANVPLVVAGSGTAHLVREAGIPVLMVDRPESWSSPGTGEAAWEPPDPHSLAYVIYTSGSTGKPKGVLITHRNVVRLFRVTDELFAFGCQDVWTLFHSYAFDFSVWEIWGALSKGGTLVVVPREVSRSPERFVELLRSEGVTVLNQTPSAFQQLIPAAVASDGALELRWVIFGGEALDPSALRPWTDRFGFESPRLVNMYGITETTVHVTFRRVGETDVLAGSRSVIGRPLPDLKLLVLDRSGRPSPVGAVGELHVGGAGLARGYLKREALTSERFIPDPYGGPGDRLYRSGDLARRLPDGDLEYIGRADNQVKVRGYRIELGEVESALARIPAVRQAVVVVRDDGLGHKRLVGYVLPEGASASEQGWVQSVREELGRRIPDHMVPSLLVPMEEFPLTPNGKVDRRALPEPSPAGLEGQAYTPPRTPTESALCEIWEEVLRLDRVGIRDNFYEVGGDSILSIQIVSRARARGLKINTRDLLVCATIEELVQAGVEEPQESANAVPAVGPAALAPIQRWFFDLPVANRHHWNQYLRTPLRPSVDLGALGRAWAAVAGQHDAFRLRFVRHSSGWRQTYEDDPDAVDEGHTVRVADIESGEWDSAIDAMNRDLDITRGPVVRAAVLRSEEGAVLVLAAHHLVVDGVSWRIILDDLESAYAAAAEGPSIPPTLSSSSYGAWTEALWRFAESAEVGAGVSQWDEVMRIPPARLPGGKEGRNCVSSQRLVTSRISIEDTAAFLGPAHRAYGTQANDLLVTALARTLVEFSGRQEQRFDLEGHGREPFAGAPDVSRTVGWFTTIFPVRVDLGGTEDLSRQIMAVKEQLARVPWKGVSYGVTRYGTGPLPDGERSAVAFNYLGRMDQGSSGTGLLDGASLVLGVSQDPRSTRPYELEILGEVVEGRLRFRYLYSSERHDESLVQAFSDGLTRHLHEIIRHCVSRENAVRTPSDFPLADLGVEELRVALSRVPEAIDLQALVPMQELFFGVSAADPSLGHEQWHFHLSGPLDLDRLREAWNQTLNRHEILRSAFISEGLSRPHRVTVSRVETPWKVVDLSGQSPESARAEVAQILKAEEAESLDLARPPLSRVTILRRSDVAHDLLWGTHHLVIDGWSWPLVLSDLSRAYQGLPFDAPQAAGYGRYVAWLRRREGSVDEAFWREYLGGIDAPTPLPGGAPYARGRVDELVAPAEPGLHGRVSLATKKFRVTLGTFVQAAWALVLSEWSSASDVVLGASYSGRPGDLQAADQIVGPFVNNLPVRAVVDRSRDLGDWLRDFQACQIEVGEHQHCSLREVHGWSGVPIRQRLFESLVVVQNYAVGEEAFRLGPATIVNPVSVPQATNYPLTVVYNPRSGPALTVIGRDGRWTESELEEIGRGLAAVILAMADTRERSVEDVVREARLGGLPQGRGASPAAANSPTATKATALETLILNTLSEALGSRDIGIHDNFFDLGAHSVLLLQVHERLEVELGRAWPVTAVFEHATVAALAAHLEGSENAEVAADRDGAMERARRMREQIRRRARRHRPSH